MSYLATILPAIMPLIIGGYLVGCVIIGKGIFRIKNILWLGLALVAINFLIH